MIYSRTNSQQRRHLNWFTLHSSDWKIKVEQTFYPISGEAEAIVPRSAADTAGLSMEISNKWDQDPGAFLQITVTGDDTPWWNWCDPEDKAQLKQWLPRGESGQSEQKRTMGKSSAKISWAQWLTL